MPASVRKRDAFGPLWPQAGLSGRIGGSDRSERDECCREKVAHVKSDDSAFVPGIRMIVAPRSTWPLFPVVAGLVPGLVPATSIISALPSATRRRRDKPGDGAGEATPPETGFSCCASA